jgi:hypothetical protein
MAHVDPPSARSPETQKERLTQLIAQWREQAAGWRRCARAETRFTGGRTDADARAHEYSACADQLEAALAADPGQGEPPQDEEVERYLAALPWSRNAHRNGTKSTTEENIRTFVRWLRGELPGIAAPARTVQAEPAPQPATTRIVHSSEIADDPGGFEGDYVPLEDHRAALALQRETRVPHPPDLIEALAAYAHEAWAGWMRHLFKRCWLREGTATIPSEWRERWERQTLMPYAELPDGEKESDRKEARRMLAIVAAARQETPAVPPAPCLCTPGVRTSLCPIHGYEGMDRAASPSSVSAPSVKEGGE